MSKENAAFDPCEHRLREALLKVGAVLYPDTKEVGVVFRLISERFGIMLPKLSSAVTNHLPPPSETGPFYKCPECGSISLSVFDLCGGCKDSEGGRYKTKTFCVQCNDLRYFEARSVVVLEDLGASFKLTRKADLGVKRVTERGVE